MIEKIDVKKFDELIASDKPVVCDFYADWCGPCKMLAPVMEKCSEIFGDKAAFVKVNIDDNFELAARYGIMSIPLIGVFKGGEMVDKSLGFTAQSETEDFLKSAL
ncbi:MAG: thioredoxin [Clostridia bacterium]|nr:thioredoxin [Clostridia bacterium]